MNWNYSKPPFARATARLGGRNTPFHKDENFICVLDYSQAVMCGHCTKHVPKCPETIKDPSLSTAVRYRVWVSALHTFCHSCAIEISKAGPAIIGMVCGKPPEIVLASGPGQERCSQCTLRRNAEPDRWCKECAGYAGSLQVLPN